MGSNYPPGADADPRAPYNQKEVEPEGHECMDCWWTGTVDDLLNGYCPKCHGLTLVQEDDDA